ncbi:MAG TPA: pyridoxamine 5'-phosphate oxidase family protein [Cyclobacteriaceae bacterium]|nr:pyridoxamine 5'-phosphate oxidase family protein [Cyclobacteriaceae bacterium]
MEKFPITDKTEITRLPKRGVYEKETVFTILDDALVCTVAFVLNGQPFQIPTGFCRKDDTLYIHGSVGSFYMRELAANKLPVCVSVTHLDGLVLARSAFHHSVNYRSVVLFSHAEKVEDKNELYKVLEIFTNKIQPGRWNDIRQPNDGEWKATMVLKFKIEEASAKVRTGGPIDDEEDYDMNTWAGVVPLKMQRQAVIADPKLKAGVSLPAYLQ